MNDVPYNMQSLVLPKQPVVIFSQSDTPNWEEKECDKSPEGNKLGVLPITSIMRLCTSTELTTRLILHFFGKAHAVTGVEKELLKSLHTNPIEIATHLNKNEVRTL